MSADRPQFGSIRTAHPEYREGAIIPSDEFLLTVYSRAAESLLSRGDIGSVTEFGPTHVENWQSEGSSREMAIYSTLFPLELQSGLVAQVGDAYVGLAVGEYGFGPTGKVNRLQFGIASLGSVKSSKDTSWKMEMVRDRKTFQEIKGSHHPDPRPDSIEDLAKIVRPHWSKDAGTIRVDPEVRSRLRIDYKTYGTFQDERGLYEKWNNQRHGMYPEDIEIGLGVIQEAVEIALIQNKRRERLAELLRAGS